MPLSVTLLYAPADRPDRVLKAQHTGADVVVIDLEDAVAPAAKASAREQLKVLSPQLRTDIRIQVRVNAIGTPWHDADLTAVREMPDHVEVRVPKIESPEQACEVIQISGGRQVHALIETALGVERAFEIASAGVTSLGLGEADLRSQLGLPAGPEGDVGLSWIRSRIITASAAAGLTPPMMSVYTRLDDVAGLLESTRQGRQHGFIGRAAIHPKQLATIRDGMRPSDAEVERARAVLERIEQAHEAGAGVLVLDDGSFLDVAMVSSAQRTLELNNN